MTVETEPVQEKVFDDSEILVFAAVQRFVEKARHPEAKDALVSLKIALTELTDPCRVYRVTGVLIGLGAGSAGCAFNGEFRLAKGEGEFWRAGNLEATVSYNFYVYTVTGCWQDEEYVIEVSNAAR